MKNKTIFTVFLLLFVATAAMSLNVITRKPSKTQATPAKPAKPADVLSRETITVNGVSFVMVRIQGGTFKMGATKKHVSDADSDSDFDYHSDEQPTHRVTLPDFSIGETEVTQALWQAVMGNNPSKFTGDTNRPVEQVSWNDCQEFIRKLNQLTGRSFRLPTEAEWEYAARGGRSKGPRYAGGNDLDAVAWYDKNACDRVDRNSPDYGTHAVKTKSPNEVSLYDMSGNVFEWCQDWYSAYSSSAQTNPQGTTNIGLGRVCRGGSWHCGAELCWVSYRDHNSPDNISHDVGLRLAL